MINNIEIVALSFFASFGFAMVFHMRRDFLIYAGLAGALTRIVYLILMQITDSRAIYICLSAMFASLYAYVVSQWKYTPSTIFFYPALIPLIPGDLLYYTLQGLILKDTNAFIVNGQNFIVALFWLGIGSVVISSCLFYWKKIKRINPLELRHH